MRARFKPMTAEARRRKAERGGMNGTEAAFAAELRRRYGCDLPFEPDTLRLATGVSYTPDFRVNIMGYCTYYEVKGSRRTKPTKRFPLGNVVPIVTEAARVRIKVAAEKYPDARFIMVWPNRGEWMSKEYSSERVLEAVGEGRADG